MSFAKFCQSLYDTAEQAGLYLVSDDFCCKLLAWLLWYGGGREEVVINLKLSTEIKIAQKRLNLFGGETPNAELQPLLRKYSQECERAVKAKTHLDWIDEIDERYKIKTPAWWGEEEKNVS